jgi:maleylacetate reductase
MNTQAHPLAHQRVRFGTGLRHEVGAEMDLLGCARAIVLSTPQQSDMALDVAATLGDRAGGMFSGATMHTPIDVTEEALQHAVTVKADCIVAIGGGSTTGLGKALSFRMNIPHICVPTTYAGSEATPILGQTENGIKTTFSDPGILPSVVLYDPQLVTSLPADLTVTSALNAMAHAVEGLYAKDRNDETTRLAIQGLEDFNGSLTRVLEDPGSLAAREATLRGAWACGTVLGRVGMALHHKLCHTIGGSFDLPHAQTHAILLPHATAFNEAAVPDLLAPVAKIFGGDQSGMALWGFARDMGAPLALKEIGLEESDLDRAAEIATRNPYWNPREIDRAGIRALLQNAWSGDAPGTC